MVDLFFSDLDNTLIYSHRIKLPGDSVAVEYLNDHVQSYMTQKTYHFLRNQKEFLLVPTTTRSVEQYDRLSDVFAEFGCRYALVCNGGVLLNRNEVDQEWLKETKRIAGNELRSLDEAGKWILRRYPAQFVHLINDIMIYIKTETPAKDADMLAGEVDLERINIYHDRNKVYCIPASITKGNALKRLSKQMGIDRSFAAGDSLTDISMLNRADAAILPAELSDAVDNQRKYVAGISGCFSDYICDVITKELLNKR